MTFYKKEGLVTKKRDSGYKRRIGHTKGNPVRKTGGPVIKKGTLVIKSGD